MPGRSPGPRRVLLLGATGTIGRAAAAGLTARGHAVTAIVRPGRDPALCEGIDLRQADLTDPAALVRDGLRGDRFDALVSCLASRTGAPADAWAIDHRAHLAALDAARNAGVRHFVLLSAICVQKPRLAFQHAKLAFEQALIASGLDWTIVRPTAYFKSLAGQIARVRDGRPFLIFGDGRLTACKPISDRDLAAFLADCLDNPERRNRILPIGGPGPAITPRAQGEMLFRLTGRAPRFRSVPPALLDAVIGGLSVGGTLSPRLRAKADLARIGRYYATESMLLLDPTTGLYDADATPETGSDRLEEFYARVLSGAETVDLGDHAVF
jgi:divinyl chlorophyllide a 8-vinyl-reductase